MDGPIVDLVSVTSFSSSMLRSELSEESFEEFGGFVDIGLPEATLIPEIGGRRCYSSYKKGRKTNREFLANIIESKHGSVLEHTNFGFMIRNVSRSLTHELVRHRAGWSYSQLSQRYVDAADTAFVEPEIIHSDPELHTLFIECVENCLLTYKQLCEGLDTKLEDVLELAPLSKTDRIKLVRQAARSVLPNATETKIFVTVNARALRHFFEVRGSIHADVEIRALAIAMFEIVQNEFYNLFQDIAMEKVDGIWSLSVKNSKV